MVKSWTYSSDRVYGILQSSIDMWIGSHVKLVFPFIDLSIEMGRKLHNLLSQLRVTIKTWFSQILRIWRFPNDQSLRGYNHSDSIRADGSDRGVASRHNFHVQFVTFWPVLASRRITEQVSVRINGELFIPPERKTPITSGFATYHPIAKLRDDVKIDFVKLREDAEKHLVFLSDGSEAGAKEKKKGKVAKEGAASGSAATFDPNEWMYADGLLDGLWKQDAIDSTFSKSRWVKERNQFLDSLRARRK
ncbi:hypothetical protein F5880DRAFT_1685309 [Lentinula raphanica]|nr:hypothetical protein F5880DRAFT_1685309 [Lentinula raphanica]